MIYCKDDKNLPFPWAIGLRIGVFSTVLLFSVKLLTKIKIFDTQCIAVCWATFWNMNLQFVPMVSTHYIELEIYDLAFSGDDWCLLNYTFGEGQSSLPTYCVGNGIEISHNGVKPFLKLGSIIFRLVFCYKMYLWKSWMRSIKKDG